MIALYHMRTSEDAVDVTLLLPYVTSITCVRLRDGSWGFMVGVQGSMTQLLTYASKEVAEREYAGLIKAVDRWWNEQNGQSVKAQ